jgi:hypothetical protein
MEQRKEIYLRRTDTQPLQQLFQPCLPTDADIDWQRGLFSYKSSEILREKAHLLNDYYT